MPNRNTGRILLAVLAGYLANAALIAISEQLLGRYATRQHYFIADVALQCFYQILAGYLCCLIAGASRTSALASLIAIGMIIGTISLVASWNAEPHWYMLTLLAVYSPCIWIGWALRAQQSI
jgi:predicted neutral ceramidase superfamily lipid hydrolase